MSRASTRVRPATPADVPGLVALIRSVDTAAGTFSGRPLTDSGQAHLASRLDVILTEGNRVLLVAVDDAAGAPIGLLVAKQDEIGAVDLTPVLHVTHLLVAPGSRRRGIGRSLIGAAVHVADERGIDHMLATVASGSREGNRYLARIGFAPLVVQRVAPTSLLRRSLGLSDAPERIAVLRRARLVRGGALTRPGLAARVVGRGA